jgi:hypothetical protein
LRIPSYWTVFASFLLGFGYNIAYSQLPETNPPAAEKSESRPIEEIIVPGYRSRNFIRMQIEFAQDEVFSIFSELNNDDELDVTCTKDVYAGSHIPKRSCMTAFMRKSEARKVQDVIQGFDIPRSRRQLIATDLLVRQKSKEMEIEMTRLAQENQSLFDALQKLVTLTAELEEK